MKIEDLAFPVTLKAFTAFQEEGTGRRLEPMEPMEREALGAWVPLFNRAFEDGRREDSTALARDLGRVNKCLSQCGDDALLTQILKSCRWWISYAWEQGAGKAVRT